MRCAPLFLDTGSSSMDRSTNGRRNHAKTKKNHETADRNFSFRMNFMISRRIVLRYYLHEKVGERGYDTQGCDVSSGLGIRFTAASGMARRARACAFCIMQQEIATLTWKVHSRRRRPIHPRATCFPFHQPLFVTRLIAPMCFSFFNIPRRI